MSRHRLPTPRSNRLSDAPAAPLDASSWTVHRDSAVALRAMVPTESLSVVFQPIVRLCDGAPFAYEALVRCSVPALANPALLIEHAVQAGCVGRLGRMIREIAVPHCSGAPIFVNIHPQELRDSWLIRPDDPIFMHDHDVYLEVTESVPLTHFDLCLTVLREVQSRGGIHVVIDDLGAGYSNLKRIADIEPSIVKLDRDLIVGIERSQRQRQLVRSVVRLCEDLDSRVVAEGIETTDEYRALLDTGVTFGQGYLFARPSFPLPHVSPETLAVIGDVSTVPPR